MNKTMFAGVGLALFVCSSLAHAGETAAQIAGRKAITANYARFCRASETKDLSALMAMVAPDFTQTHLDDHVLNRAAFEASMRAGLRAPIRYKPVTFKIQSLQWNGNNAVVVAEIATTLTRTDVKAKSIIIREVSRDSWKSTTMGWKIYKSVDLKVTQS